MMRTSNALTRRKWMLWNAANRVLQCPGEIPIPAAMAPSSRDRHTSRLVAIAVHSPTRSILRASRRPLAARVAAIRTAPGQRSADLLVRLPKPQVLDGFSNVCYPEPILAHGRIGCDRAKAWGSNVY